MGQGGGNLGHHGRHLQTSGFDDVVEKFGTTEAFVLMYSWSIGNTIGELAVVDEIFLGDKGGDLDDIFLTLTYS